MCVCLCVHLLVQIINKKIKMHGMYIIIKNLSISFNRIVFNKNFQVNLQFTVKITFLSHIFLRAGRKHGHKKTELWQ